MFIKALFLVLLGTSLVLANPISQESVETQTAKSFSSKLFDFVKNKFHSVRDAIKGFGEFGAQYAKDTQEKISEIGNSIKITVVEFSRKQYSLFRQYLGKLKEGAEAAFKVIVDKYEKLEKEFPEKRKELAEKLQAELKEEAAKWVEKTKELVENPKNLIDKYINKNSEHQEVEEHNKVEQS